MYCKNCGKEIAGDSKFCNHCGSSIEESPRPQQPQPPQPEATEPSIHTQPERDHNDDVPEVRKPIFEEFQWNVSEYPDRNVVEKTEEIDFNWNANPADIPESPRRTVKAVPREQAKEQPAVPAHSAQRESEAEVLKGEDLEREVLGQPQPPKDREEMSAMEKVNSFYTLNQKNAEFQKLIDAEYQRVKSGNALEHELSEADRIADERMESRPLSNSMDDFFEREGVVQPYQPKAFESDVLQKIEAQEAQREAEKREEEARLAALEEARREAEAKIKAEEEARAAEEAKRRAEEEAAQREAEARRKAEEEARLAAIEEAEAKRRAEEEAKRLEELARQKAAEEARAAEEAKRRAEEEARKAAEEAKRRAEEEARKRAEEEARLRAEAEARVKAAEEARLKAEADLKAAQEAAKIRAQQEARLAAAEEARFKAEQERKRLEAEEAERQLEEKRKRLAEEANQAVAQEEVKKVLEQTARMRKEEEAKIKAAVAGLRGVAPEKPEVSKEVEEAHQATKNQINEMARARDAYFAEIEERESAARAKKKERVVTGRETMLSSDDSARTRVIKKADIEAGLNEATRVVSGRPAPAPADDDEFFNSLEAAGAAAITEEAQSIDFKPDEPINDFDDLLSQFETVSSAAGAPEGQPEQPEEVSGLEPLPDQYAAVDKPGLDDTAFMPQDESVDSLPANDFDSYGNEEALHYANQQSMRPQSQPQNGGGFESDAADAFYDDDFYSNADDSLSKKELKQKEKEQRRIEKEEAKADKARKKKEKRDFIEASDDDYEETSGKGRIALKVILVILVIILIAEIVGMGIRFLAPQSKAAELIDNQLNKVIQLITGDDTEYSVIAAQTRTEPMDDKTDLINAQKGKNKDGNIETITYSADLGYDQETDGQISDLVLSRPMTVVEWGRDEENYPVYYDEQVIGRIIAFESNKVNLMNKGDERALNMIDPKGSLYAETEALKGQKMGGKFTKLEIGEIREAGTTYYVWVRETIGGNTVEKVYSMYPEKEFVMKMAACYEI